MSIYLKFTSVIILLLFFSCNEKSPNLMELEHFSLDIPEGLATHKAVRNRYEILDLKYKDELFVTIKDFIGEGHKEKDNEFSIKDVFDTNFKQMMLGYDGKMPSKLKQSKINGFESMSKEFRSQIPGGGDVYFEYIIMKINKRYFELTFTGKNSTRKEQKFLLDKLLNSIEEN